MIKKPKTKIHYWQYIVKDRSSWTLILSNIMVICVALYEGWGLYATMAIYWMQSVIIGIFNVAKILSLNPSTTITGPLRKIAGAGNILMALFFAFHYGLFHFGYYELLRGSFKKIDPRLLLTTAAVFFLNHLFSFIYNFKNDSRFEDVGRIMFIPYERIMPMHVTIIFGTMIMFALKERGESAALLFFLLLKTTADVRMHVLEHVKLKY